MLMRLCSKCGRLLVKDKDVYRCPRGHGEWVEGQGIRDQPVIRHNGNLAKPYEAGAIVFTGTKSSGKKRKKPPKVEILKNIFDRPL